MDQEHAIELINQTFKHDFDFERFSLFIKQLFNHFNLRIKKNILLRKEYYDHINQMDSLGVYTDDNGDSIEVFAVQLKKTRSRDRARTMQRNLVARYLKNSDSNAALVAFYGDDPQDWRFSFVKIEYDLIKDEKGNLKVKEDITPARRFSFLVGKNEPNHTCRRQFLSLIENEDKDPLLKDIEHAFSIEKVTLEFFEKYKNLFLKLQKSLEDVIKSDKVVKEEFKNKNIPTADFAKKLMGQIVFIYFLQKKGWLGVDKDEKWGKGPRNFLRELFDKKEYNNFFNDVLEPLFYEALATPRDDDYYRHFDCKIPFLNGGLFEPINDYNWIKTEILLKNKIFEDILEVFDLYNFTIKEDEPLEKEVAVDPEMLGKVFENLLDDQDRKYQGAFYTPREIVHYMCQESIINYLNTNSDLKREDLENFIHLGDFALDLLIREIIEFGKLREDREYGLSTPIKENHAELDQLLQQIKVVDPAVGSGAFPVGMMNEIVKARSILSFLSGEEKSNYQLKLETIRDCLYGVDIDSSAVDITKLRFWLSIIVDEEDIETIDPLPNIDHKIMCGNSLLEGFEGKKLFDENLLGEIIIDHSAELENIDKERSKLYIELGMIHTGKIKDKSHKKDIAKALKKLDNKEKKLKSIAQDSLKQFTLDDDYETRRIKESQRKLKQLDELHEQFFSEQNTKKKKKYRKEFERIEWEFIEESLREDGNENSIQKLEEYKRKKSKPFFLWKLYFHEVFQRQNPGFDIIIANPPYIGEKDHKDLFEPVAEDNLGKYYLGKMNYFYFFFHLALNLGRENSNIALITTNYYLKAEGAKKLRKDFYSRASILKLINFNELKIFESAKGQHNIITILNKCKDPDVNAFVCYTKRTGLANAKILQSILSGIDKKTFYQHTSQNKLYEDDDFKIRTFSSPESKSKEINSILEKIKNKSNFKLDPKKEVAQGIVPNPDVVNKRAIKKISQEKISKYNIKVGDHVFIVPKSFSKNLNKNEKSYLKPLYEPHHLDKYYFPHDNEKYIIYLTKKNYKGNLSNILKHLQKYREIMDDRRENKNGRLEFYHLHWPRDEKFFNKGPKIFSVRKCKAPTFIYTEDPAYAMLSINVIISQRINLKYLLAIFNSKLVAFWLKYKGKMQGKQYQIDKQQILDIPLKHENENEFINHVNRILEITNETGYITDSTKRKKVKVIENQIDELVYQIYELSPEEIEIINSEV